MSRLWLATLVLAGWSASVVPVTAQDWARKMFPDNSHDFGIVAAGSEAVHRFEFTNPLQEDVRVVSVRSSCGCTSATIENNDLKPGETGAIVARFNTVSFRDRKQATLTVTLDRPRYAEVQLIVRGNIRGNVAFEPGSVQFGDIVAGNPASRTIRVVQRGGSNWKITDVKTTFDHNRIKVRLNSVHRGNGQVVYDLEVELQDNIESGYVAGELFVETNEGLRYPLRFHGRVTAPLKMGPEILTMGPLAPGESIHRRVLLRADEPFRIQAIESSDERLVLKASDKSNRLHVIDVRFTAGDQPGVLQGQADILTDHGDSMRATLRTIAIVEDDPLAPIRRASQQSSQGEAAADAAPPADAGTAPETGGQPRPPAETGPGR